MSFNVKSIVLKSLVTLGCTALPGIAAAQDYNSRSNYGDPDSVTSAQAKRRGPCNDPWVTLALTRVYGTVDPAKCTVSLYNGGRWNNFNELVHAVARNKNARTAQSAVKLAPAVPASQVQGVGIAPTSTGLVAAGSLNAKPPAQTGILTRDGAGLIGNDGAGIKQRAGP